MELVKLYMQIYKKEEGQHDHKDVILPFFVKENKQYLI